MEVSKWKNDKKDKLVIMRTNKLCERSVNYLSYFPLPLEDELYGDEDAFKQWETNYMTMLFGRGHGRSSIKCNCLYPGRITITSSMINFKII